eukprot:6322819-Amphidinium_carterae.1
MAAGRRNPIPRMKTHPTRDAVHKARYSHAGLVGAGELQEGTECVSKAQSQTRTREPLLSSMASTRTMPPHKQTRDPRSSLHMLASNAMRH